MRIVNLKKYGRESILTYGQLSSFSGENSQENPILIEQSEVLPVHLKISKSSLHVRLNKCSFNTLNLKRCQNIRIVDCTCKILQLENCSNIEIEGCRIKTTLYLRKSSQMKFNNCSIARFDLIGSYENHMENSIIEKAFNHFSSGNTFKNIQIPEKYKEYLLENKLIKKLLSILLPLILLITLSSTIRLWKINKFSALWTLIFLTMGLLIASLSYYFGDRKMKTYKKNSII